MNWTLDQALAVAIQQHNAGRLPEAENLYRQILALKPDHATALHNLGEIALRVRKLDLALDLVSRAVAIEPRSMLLRNTLAVILFSLGRADESRDLCEKILEAYPNFSHGHVNLAICKVDSGDLAGSIRSFERAIELEPGNPNAHDGLGLSLLMSGQLQRGWREQEWRWRKSTFEMKRDFGTPSWDGSDLSGKTIFLHVEQGYGDVFQFCRYAPLLAARGARVFLETVSDALDLMKSLAGVSGFVLPGETIPPADFHCALMSVPLWYGTTLETIPADVPYLQPDENRLAKWKEFFRPDRNLKIGIAWAGRPTHNNDHNRSTSLASFAALANLPGVTFYSLQKGDAQQQLQNPPPGMKLVDLSPRLNDFCDSAAAIAGLDLVISVDTSIVHLAGAMAKPVWTLLPFCPDWRWMLNRSDSPWYPTMRLFRAPRRGDWAGIFANAKAALMDWMKERRDVVAIPDNRI